MILLTERIDEHLKSCLQKQIKVTVKERNIHTGKLLVYRVDGFYVELTFASESGPTRVEVPYPFNIIAERTKLVFDYRLDSLAETDFNLLFALQSISKKRESKFYNSTLEIHHT